MAPLINALRSFNTRCTQYITHSLAGYRQTLRRLFSRSPRCSLEGRSRTPQTAPCSVQNYTPLWEHVVGRRFCLGQKLNASLGDGWWMFSKLVGIPDVSGNQFGNRWVVDFNVDASTAKTADGCEVVRQIPTCLFHLALSPCDGSTASTLVRVPYSEPTQTILVFY